MKRRKLSLITTLLILLGAQCWAQQGQALLLYKSSEEASPTTSRLALRVDPILATLGFERSYHDVDQGLPPTVEADLIVSWFSTPKIADPEGYVDWMANQISRGKKVIVLGNFGAHTMDGKTWLTNESLNRFFYPFGLSYGAAYTGDPNLLEVSKQSGPARAPSPLNYYLLFSSVNAENQVYLEVKRTDLEDSQSALVVRTPFGAMAQEVYVDNTDLNELIAQTVQSEKRSAATEKKLLGLYKSSEGVDARTNFLARFVAPTLFDLGYGLDYYDIEQGLPSDSRMNQYQGVISWYTTPELAKAADYINWLAKQLDADRRVVVLGNFGAFAEDIPSSAGVVRRFLQSPEYNKFFYPFGLEFRGAWTPEKKSVQVAQKDSSVLTWLEPDHVGHYYWIRSVHPDNEPYLTVRRADLEDGDSAVVVATPRGGLALESYVLGTDPATKKPRMHLDLKKFLGASLTLQATSDTKLEPATAELVSRPPLPPLPAVKPEGDRQYPGDVKPFKRQILAFYQTSANETSTENQTFLAGQMVLEHLGLIVDYHDLDSGTLPTQAEMEKYQGILLWLAKDAVPNARQFDGWLQENVERGRKLVLIGDYQIREKDSLSLINPKNLYAKLGLAYDPLGQVTLNNIKGQGSFRQAPRNPSVVQSKPGYMDFERKLNWSDHDLKGNWHLVRSVWPDSEIGLTVNQAGGASDAVVVSKSGAAAIGPFAIYTKGAVRKKRAEVAAKKDGSNKAQAEDVGGDPWRLDPFRFFAKGFQVETMPKADVTTLNGSRIYYSHIDGDAFGGISLIDRSSLNGTIMYKRVLQSLPLPVTVSYVTQDVERRLDERYSRELSVARQIFELPNIEPASHTYSHPFDWENGDLALAQGSDYKLTRKDIDLEQEIVHSLDFVDKLCPPNKRCEILLWSGRCNPKPEAVELVRKKGLLNMNGSESTFDTKFPYIAGVLPLYGDVGDEVQFHVSAAGDFYYTNSWTGDYDGMKNLPDYFNRTESPRRLRCLNVYYHFYLAERQPGLDGLRVAYDDALRRSPAPMFASEYAEILKDTMETKLGRDSQNRYWLSNRGKSVTMRFDDEARFPDLQKSVGVIGFNRANDSLYVHLDGRGEARVALSEQRPSQPYVERFTHRIKDWKAAKGSISFTADGQGPAYLRIGNLIPSSSYRIDAGSGEATVRTDAQGWLEWTGRFDGYDQSHQVRLRKVTP